MKIPTIEELTEAINQRRREILGNDPQYAYLQGQLQLLQAMKEEEKDE